MLLFFTLQKYKPLPRSGRKKLGVFYGPQGAGGGALGYLGLRCGGRRCTSRRSLLTAHKKSIKYKLLAHRLALYNHPPPPPQRKHTARRSVCGAEAECLSSSLLLFVFRLIITFRRSDSSFRVANCPGFSTLNS